MQIVVAALWGLIAAVTAAMIAFGLGIAVFWAFVFGDHAWPAWSLSAIASASILLGLAAGILAGRRIWMHVQRIGSISPRARQASLRVWLLAGVGATALLIAWIAHER